MTTSSDMHRIIFTISTLATVMALAWAGPVRARAFYRYGGFVPPGYILPYGGVPFVGRPISSGIAPSTAPAEGRSVYVLPAPNMSHTGGVND